MGRLKNRLFGMYGSFVTVGRVCYKRKIGLISAEKQIQKFNKNNKT